MALRGAAGAGAEQPFRKRETTCGGGIGERRGRNPWWWEKVAVKEWGQDWREERAEFVVVGERGCGASEDGEREMIEAAGVRKI